MYRWCSTCHVFFPVPSRPFNVSFRDVTNSSVTVRWQRPRHPNGLVQGYRLYYMHRNYTDVQTVREPSEEMDFELQGLGEPALCLKRSLLLLLRHRAFSLLYYTIPSPLPLATKVGVGLL